MKSKVALLISFLLLGHFGYAQDLKKSIKAIKNESKNNEIFEYSEKTQKVSLTIARQFKTNSD